MDTGTKILIGTVVVVGGVVAYKMLNKPAPVARQTVPNQTPANVNGFLNLATSVFGYFTKHEPQPPVSPGTQGIDPNTGGVYLAPGETYGPVLN